MSNMDNVVQDTNLVSKDLLPTTDKERNVSTLELFFLWAAIAVNIGAFAVALSMYPMFSPIKILGVVITGFLICVILMFFTGDIGLTYGITYSVYIRSCFGTLGSHFAGAIRVLSCIFWAGFQTYVAATALSAICLSLTGYSNFWVSIIIFSVLQIYNAAKGVKSMAIFDTFATVFLAIALVVLTGVLLSQNNQTIIGVFSMPAVPTDKYLSLPLAIASAAGGWICIAPTFMDITRTMKRSPNFATQNFWQRNKGVLIATLLGITVISPTVVSTGMISGLLSGTWNPIEYAVQAFPDNPLMLILCFLAVLFAQWSTNTAANMLPAANIIVNFNPKRITYVKAVVIVGVVSVVIMPWRLLVYFVNVMAFLAAVLGPVLGIMLSDYFLIRKRKLNVAALYQKGGQYSYWKEYNPAAIVTLIISIILIFIVWFDYGFYVGFVVSIILYWLLMKYWIIPKYPQAELADDYQPDYFYHG
jgi:NCS1 family nucleobase:cation symporter-1